MKKNSKLTVEKRNTFSYRTGSIDGEVTDYAAYYCTGEAYYELLVQCRTKDIEKWGKYIIEILNSAEFVKMPV